MTSDGVDIHTSRNECDKKSEHVSTGPNMFQRVEHDSMNRSSGKYFIAGSVGGICTTLYGHPFDTIKVRMQTMPYMYTKTWDALKLVIKHEGFLGLYKGMMPPMIGVIPIFGLSFYSYNVGKKLVAGANCDNKNLMTYELIVSGMISGLATTPLTVPGERIKCLLQIQSVNSRKYSGFINCASKLLREGGLRNLYVGTCATLLRDIPASGAYFTVYETVLRALSNYFHEITIWPSIFAGGIAGMANWAIAMPADVLKSRLQTSSIDEYPRGMRSLLPKILREEGPWILYKGIVPIMIRAVPANAMCFLGIEITMKVLN